MERVHKVVDFEQLRTTRLCLATDWTKCFLCQEDKPEVLHCPAHSKCDTQGAGLHNTCWSPGKVW